MKVYISSSITSDYNYKEKFIKAQKHLENMGHVVLNPICLPLGLDWEDYIEIDLKMVERADAIYFLDEWRESKGATIELLHSVLEWFQKRHKQLWIIQEKNENHEIINHYFYNYGINKDSIEGQFVDNKIYYDLSIEELDLFCPSFSCLIRKNGFTYSERESIIFETKKLIREYYKNYKKEETYLINTVNKFCKDYDNKQFIEYEVKHDLGKIIRNNI